MAHHEIKIWTDFFGRVQRGDKKAEVRKNDRGFQKGDTVEMKEWYPHLEKYSGSSINVVITDVTPLDRVGIANHVLFSFDLVNKSL